MSDVYEVLCRVVAAATATIERTSCSATCTTRSGRRGRVLHEQLRERREPVLVGDLHLRPAVSTVSGAGGCIAGPGMRLRHPRSGVLAGCTRPRADVRHYDPTTGTFLQRDPLDGVNGTTTVTNPYHYGANDPLNRADPLGLRPDECSLGGLCNSVVNDLQSP